MRKYKCFPGNERHVFWTFISEGGLHKATEK